ARGDTAMVVGLGSIGCLLARAFSLAGAAVFGADLVAGRRALGRRAGARVPDEAGGLDAGVTAGTAARDRDGGQLRCFAGGAGKGLPLSLADLCHRELTISATYSSSPVELREAFDLLSRGRVTVDRLIIHR